MPNHVCNKTFLAYMGVDEDFDEADEDQPESSTEAEVITADLSHIYALDGKHRSDAIELQGSIGAAPVLILVNTGSTHDFLYPRVAEKLALPLTRDQTISSIRGQWRVIDLLARLHQYESGNSEYCVSNYLAYFAGAWCRCHIGYGLVEVSGTRHE